MLISWRKRVVYMTDNCQCDVFEEMSKSFLRSAICFKKHPNWLSYVQIDIDISKNGNRRIQNEIGWLSKIKFIVLNIVFDSSISFWIYRFHFRNRDLNLDITMSIWRIYSFDTHGAPQYVSQHQTRHLSYPNWYKNWYRYI